MTRSARTAGRGEGEFPLHGAGLVEVETVICDLALLSPGGWLEPRQRYLYDHRF